VSTHITQLGAILASQRMRYDDLAKLTGLARRTLHNIANGNNRTRRGRSRVEGALGVRIWDRPGTALQASANKPSENEKPSSKD
jgi:transcriptional regulator with XRE-family HTH domain